MQYKHKRAGFSLTEVLIALLVFCASLAALAKFESHLIATNNLAAQRSEALGLTEQKLEALRDYSVVNTTSGYIAYEDIVSGSDTVTGNNATYTRTWTVTNYTTIAYNVVDITTTWTASNGSSKSLTLSTVIASIDPASSGLAIKGGGIGSGGLTP